ncbi:PAS domain S-box protein [Marinospirillum sp.]|uniref:PAS domain S-box protein n=1 Tax=Marinospirillum sp. TaxID=2183934 RepID=UPI00384CECCE
MPHKVRQIQAQQRRFRNWMLLAGWSLAVLISLLAAFGAQGHLLTSVMVLALGVGLVALLWMDKRTGRALDYAREKSEALEKVTDALRQREFAMDQHSIISMTDPEGCITYANDLFVAISGYSREELYGNTHRLINSGHHPQEFFTVMWNQITQGLVWHGEIKNINKAKEVYWVAATLVPLLDQNGQPEAYISIRTDITRQKQLEESLSQQNKELQELTDHLSEHSHLLTEIIEAIPLPVYLKDNQGRYQQLNRAFEEYFGIQREDYLGRDVFDLLEVETARVHHSKDQQLFREQGRQSYQARNQRSDGHFADAVYKKAALLSADGQARGLVGVIFDVTERQHWEAGLVEARKAAEAANQAKSQFLANMSHEIRTPMNGILGMLDLVLETRLDSEQKEHLDLARLSAEHLLEIINHLLDISKIEAGKLGLQPSVFNLHELLDQTLRSLSSRAQAKGLKLVYDPGEGLPSYVYADPARLRQMLINLLGNAIKFTQKGEVRLQVRCLDCQSKQARVELQVTDTGIGMSAEELEKVFEPFEQVQSERNRQFEGTGLGLAIVKQLAAMMGGEVSASSEPEVGSTFILHLPLLLAEKPADLSETDPTHHLPTAAAAFCKGLKLLVAEDNLVNQKLAVKLLEKQQHQVTVVADGQQALQRLQQESFDLVLMDMMMPVMDGLEATRQWRQWEEDQQRVLTPIIAMTANAMQGDRERCLAEGMQGYVPKPVHAQVLYREIDRVMATRQPGAQETFLESPRPKPATEFDWDLALDNLGADASLLRMALQMFVDEYPEHKAQLHAAWQSGDLRALGAVAHTLKSLLATFAAYPAQKEAERLEFLAKQGADHPELKAVLEKLQKRLDVLLPLLHQQLQNQ